jgi:hypothetical protein
MFEGSVGEEEGRGMTRKRRRMVRWVVVVMLATPWGLDVSARKSGILTARAEPRVEIEAERRAARRRWALRKMDEMANERLRCHERFTKRVQVETCEADFTRRLREFNELYLEASRE